MNQEKIGRFMRELRIEKEMTQQELADLSDLSHGYIREIESLKMHATFSLDAVEKIANALEIEFIYLFEEPTKQKNN